MDRAVTVDDAVTVVRFSKERLPDPIEAVVSVGEGLARFDVLRSVPKARVLLVGIGQFAGLALDVADRLADQGVMATVVDPLWCLPVSDDLAEYAGRFDVVVTIEDNLVVGGVGQQLRAVLDETDGGIRVHCIGIPQRFLAHGSRQEVLEEVGLTAPQITLRVLDFALADEQRGMTHSDQSKDSHR